MTVTVTGSGGSTPGLPAAINVTATVSGAAVIVNWQAGSPPASRVTKSCRNGQPVAIVSANTFTWSDSSVTAGSTYTFVVRSFDTQGNYSPSSQAVQVTIPTSPVHKCQLPCSRRKCLYRLLLQESRPDWHTRGGSHRRSGELRLVWKPTGTGNCVIPIFGSWQGQFTFDAGVYVFTAIASDGMRLYIDGELVISAWQDQPPAGSSVQRTLTAGAHTIAMDYYGRNGTTAAHLSWQGPVSLGGR